MSLLWRLVGHLYLIFVVSPRMITTVFNVFILSGLVVWMTFRNWCSVKLNNYCCFTLVERRQILIARLFVKKNVLLSVAMTAFMVTCWDVAARLLFLTVILLLRWCERLF